MSYDALTHQSKSIYSLPVDSENSIDLFVYGYSSQVRQLHSLHVPKLKKGCATRTACMANRISVS